MEQANQQLPINDIIRLTGCVERITFHNPQNGFCVLRVNVNDRDELVTVVANAATIAVGEHIQCHGKWHQDKTYGLQFQAEDLHSILPNTLDGIEKYLSSGLVKGIGQHYAKILINAFGEEIFYVLDHDHQRLMSLPGIGKKRKKQIIQAWTEQKSVRDIMLFLQSHGMGTARAVRIYKTYGDKAIAKVTENPYRLAGEIHGIGFKIADALAMRLGVATNSLQRAQAGIRHLLQELCAQGNCAVLYEELVRHGAELLEIEQEIIVTAIAEEVKKGRLVQEKFQEADCIFPLSLYQAEVIAAEQVKRLAKGNPPWGKIDIEAAIPWMQQQTGLQLAPSQCEALKVVLQNKMTIITGGPGVGKTTIINSLLKMIRAKQLSIGLCAPTGRAAKRLNEATKLTAKTIHRLLAFQPEVGSFKYHEDHPLPIDVLIVDESSMIDIMLFQHLLRAVPDHAAVIMVGDIDQLPSVGSGAVLMDLIQSKLIPTVKLTEIFRQAHHSKIILNAHRINQGEVPLANDSAQSDFFTIYTQKQEDILSQVIELMAARIPKYLSCDPLTDIQVLSPMNRGPLGTVALNAALQARLNGKSEPKITRFDITFAPGDKVIQIVNNYEKEVFNGDIGFISQINLQDNKVKVVFDQHLVTYDFNELDELNLAYAISIHKSQGSEFPVVIIPLASQHYLLLARNLLYTGVTRGKKLVVLIGEKRAVQMAVNNNSENKRITKLAQRLQDEKHANTQ